MLKRNPYLKPSPAFLAGKCLKDPDYCWFGCCTHTTLKNQLPPLYVLPMVKADISGVLTEKGNFCQCYHLFCTPSGSFNSSKKHFWERPRYLSGSIFSLLWKHTGHIVGLFDGQGIAGKRVKPASKVVLWNSGGLSSVYALPVQTTSGPSVRAYIFHSHITQAFEKFSCYLKITPRKLRKPKKSWSKKPAWSSGHIWSVGNGQLKNILNTFFSSKGDKIL